MLWTKNTNSDEFGGLTRIFPSANEIHNDMYESLESLRHLYCRLTNGKEMLGNSEFERKLYAVKWLQG